MLLASAAPPKTQVLEAEITGSRVDFGGGHVAGSATERGTVICADLFLFKRSGCTQARDRTVGRAGE